MVLPLLRAWLEMLLGRPTQTSDANGPGSIPFALRPGQNLHHGLAHLAGAHNGATHPVLWGHVAAIWANQSTPIIFCGHMGHMAVSGASRPVENPKRKV
jgi:hypothetical protein